MRYRYATIPELRAALEAGTTTPVELAAEAIEMLETIAPRFNGLAATLRIRAHAEASSARTDGSALAGIPYAAKDLFAAAGAPTTWGSLAFRDRVLEDDAVAIERLAAAGGVLVAKTTMAEFAGGGRARVPGASMHGSGRNPWNPDRYSGGSSAGSGIVVALGLVPYALGTETGGSVVGPAAFSGVTGIRPTFGLVPRTGVMMLAQSLDKVGVLARAAEDIATVLTVISGPDPGDADATGRFTPLATAPALRVGVIARDGDEWEPEAAGSLATGMAEFRSLVGGITPVDLPPNDEVNWALETIVTTEGAANFAEHLHRPDFAMTDAKQLATLRTGMDLSERDRRRVDVIRAGAIETAVRLFDSVEVIVVASRTGTAPSLDIPRAGRKATASDMMRAIANLAGLPGVSFPCGLGDDGLPVGLQIVGRRGSDAALLALVAAYQRETKHHLLRPPPLDR
jgi:aspartyl-tRNA(Asn)/glutamyl-tRNA(Gln) amidotransferase subunit A